MFQATTILNVTRPFQRIALLNADGFNPKSRRSPEFWKSFLEG